MSACRDIAVAACDLDLRHPLREFLISSGLGPLCEPVSTAWLMSLLLCVLIPWESEKTPVSQRSLCAIGAVRLQSTAACGDWRPGGVATVGLMKHTARQTKKTANHKSSSGGLHGAGWADVRLCGGGGGGHIIHLHQPLCTHQSDKLQRGANKRMEKKGWRRREAAVGPRGRRGESYKGKRKKKKPRLEGAVKDRAT